MLVLSAAGRGERIWAAATDTSLLRSSAAKPASLNLNKCVTPMNDHIRRIQINPAARYLMPTFLVSLLISGQGTVECSDVLIQ